MIKSQAQVIFERKKTPTICISGGIKNNTPWLGFSPLEEKDAKNGKGVLEDAYHDENKNFDVLITFEDVNAIDAVMNHLQRVKDLYIQETS